MKRWQAGLILALLFAVMCYVGPSKVGKINADADTGAMYVGGV